MSDSETVGRTLHLEIGGFDAVPAERSVPFEYEPGRIFFAPNPRRSLWRRFVDWFVDMLGATDIPPDEVFDAGNGVIVLPHGWSFAPWHPNRPVWIRFVDGKPMTVTLEEELEWQTWRQMYLRPLEREFDQRQSEWDAHTQKWKAEAKLRTLRAS